MSGNWYVSMTLAVELSPGSSVPRDLSSNVKISLTGSGQLTSTQWRQRRRVTHTEQVLYP